MRKAYVDYVSEKIKNICATSQAEHKAVFAVDKCSGMSELTLIDVTENSYTLYHCKINRNTEPSKIKIDFISEDISHSFSRMLSTEITDRYNREWNKLFVEKAGKLYYDDYCDRYLCPESLLADMRCEFEAIKSRVRTDMVAVCSDYIQFKPFRYVLEQTFHNHIIIDAESEVSLNGRIDIDMALQKTKVGIGNPCCNLIRAIKLKEPIYVPLCEETLSSAFWEDVTWGDIVGRAPVSAEIEGVGMAVITLRFSIDAYQNVFVLVKELSRNSFRIVWLHKSDVGGNMPDSLRTNDIVSAISEQKTKNSDSITSESAGSGKANPNSLCNRPAGGNDVRVEPNIGANEFVFIKIKFPPRDFIHILDRIDTKSLKEWLDKVNTAISRIENSELVLTDTNLWITESVHEPGQMRFRWFVERIVNKFEASEGRCKIEISSDVYDEIDKLSVNNPTAKSAKVWISDCLLQGNAAYVPNMRKECKGKGLYADPTVIERFEELYTSGKNVSLISNDTALVGRTVSIANNLNLKLPAPAIIRPINLEYIYRLKDRISRILKLRKTKKV